MDIAGITAHLYENGVDPQCGAGVMVIADDGLAATLLVLEGYVHPGVRFGWGGTVWEIVGERPHVRVLVAHPVAH